MIMMGLFSTNVKNVEMYSMSNLTYNDTKALTKTEMPCPDKFPTSLIVSAFTIYVTRKEVGRRYQYKYVVH